MYKFTQSIGSVCLYICHCRFLFIVFFFIKTMRQSKDITHTKVSSCDLGNIKGRSKAYNLTYITLFVKFVN